MTTFDLAEVREFTATIDARLKQCDNGEGTACATLEESLQHYAGLCDEFREGVRAWGRAVFSGHVVFDPEVERLVLVEGKRLLDQAVAKADHASVMESDHAQLTESGCCYVLDGLPALRSSLRKLSQFFDPWVTPGLSVGPAARVRLHHTPEQLEAILAGLAARRSTATWRTPRSSNSKRFSPDLRRCPHCPRTGYPTILSSDGSF